MALSLFHVSLFSAIESYGVILNHSYVTYVCVQFYSFTIFFAIQVSNLGQFRRPFGLSLRDK